MVSSDNSHQTKVGKVVGLLILQVRGFETTTLSETQKEERLFVKRHRQHRPVQSEGVLPLVFEKFPGVVSVPTGEEVTMVTLSAPAPPVVGHHRPGDGGGGQVGDLQRVLRQVSGGGERVEVEYVVKAQRGCVLQV